MSKVKSKMIYSGCGCEVIEHFPDFCPDCRIAELQAETKMANIRINELEADLAKAKLSNKGMHKTIERLTEKPAYHCPKCDSWFSEDELE